MSITKRKKFRELLSKSGYFFLMEAHDGLSARIVEESGFPAIWASGLSITAALGVRDNNEISYTQLLDVLEYMNDATELPILVDGDTGYGNFNNASVLVRKLEDRGIAAVCIEDKKFPKTNSFLENSMDDLADPAEFVGKIRAMKAAQRTDDFTVVARLESLIAGAGIEDAVKRANLYLEAGADALLVHSKRSDSNEIDGFLASFDKDAPIFLVPTKYYSVPVSHLTKDRRVKGIIWANQNVRACVKAMQDTCARIYNDSSIAGVEDGIVSVAEIFRLQRQAEFEEMEKKYLPEGAPDVAVILAAGSPGILGVETPKSLITIQGSRLLDHQVTALKSVGISKTIVVRGYKKELFSSPDYTYVDNDYWEETNAMYSLALASKKLEEPYFTLFGDVFFKRYLLQNLVLFANQTDSDIVLVCVRENYIYGGYFFKTDKNIDFLGNTDNARITEVLDADSCFEVGDNILYFSGLMFIKNYESTNKLLVQDEKTILKPKTFFQNALDAGLSISTLIASTDAVVDINTVNDLMKADGKL